MPHALYIGLVEQIVGIELQLKVICDLILQHRVMDPIRRDLGRIGRGQIAFADITGAIPEGESRG
ncbi:hypothetical protein D3C84_1286070 [compost metagenome]